MGGRVKLSLLALVVFGVVASQSLTAADPALDADADPDAVPAAGGGGGDGGDTGPDALTAPKPPNPGPSNGDACPDGRCSELVNGMCFQGICRCKFDYYDNGDGLCTKRIAANGQCTVDERIPYQCNQYPIANCVRKEDAAGPTTDGTCRCIDTHYANATRGGSCKERIRAGVSCDPDLKIADNKQCIDNAQCDRETRTCLCDDANFNKGGTCSPRIHVTKECDTESPEMNQCVDHAFCSSYNDSYSACQCEEGYYHKSETVCQKKLNLTVACDEGAVETKFQCIDANATCQTSDEKSVCLCGPNHYVGKDFICHESIPAGVACDKNITDDKQCVPGAKCFQFRSEHMCTCKNDYRDHWGECLQVPATTPPQPVTATDDDGSTYIVPTEKPPPITVLPPLRLEDLIG